MRMLFRDLSQNSDIRVFPVIGLPKSFEENLLSFCYVGVCVCTSKFLTIFYQLRSVYVS